MSADHPILFFDGVCNLCNGAVQFIIRHDKAGKIRFASLQSEAGKQAVQKVRELYGSEPDSLVFLQNGHYYIYADAALHAASLLDGGWKFLKAGFLFPAFIRNSVYRFIARRRYRWFGRRDACMIPTPELRSRFLAV